MQATPGLGHSRKETAIFVIVVIGMAALVAALSFSSSHRVTTNGPEPKAVAQGLGAFESYSQLLTFMDANAKSAQQYRTQGALFGGAGIRLLPGVMNMQAAVAATFQVSTSAVTFTGTNVQVQGVDEPDRVKTDGSHLFVSTNDAVTIMDAYPPNSTLILSTLTFHDTSVLGVEISQDRLLVIDQRDTNTTHVDLLLYNVTDLSSPTLMENISIAGEYVAARLSQDYAYAIVQQPSYQFNSNGNATAVLPVETENGVTTTLQPSSVHYTPSTAQIGYYTMVVSMSMSTGRETTLSILTGPSSTIYVSASNIYIVYANYVDYYADSIPGDIFTGGVISSTSVGQGENSTIIRASYSDGQVTVAAAGTVPGTVLNQFSMDEYDGYFRVATSRFAVIENSSTRSDDVYVLNQNMNQVSALRDIAPGENIYAVRFVGSIGYVVTFEQVDPLFVISFRNMSNPAILSALKVMGYSDYLHPLPGGYLIGVGKDAVPSSTGNFAYYLGLKLSLFRVFGNGTSVQVSKYMIGDRGTDSPVLNDHLAFTFDSSKNITVIPVLLAQVSGNKTYDPNSPPPFGDYVWQGVYILKVTPEGFAYLGRLSQYPSGQNYGDSPDSALQIDRSVVIGNYLYTISQGEVMVSDLSSFSTVGSVQLPS